MSGLAARLLTSGEELVALAPSWWALWRRLPNATPFTSPAWLVPWWRHFHPGDLVVVTVERDGSLVGLALFYREDGALGRRLLPLGISISDDHDILLDPTDLEAACALVDAIVAAGDWERWDCEELRADGNALQIPLAPGLREERAAASACPTLALDGADLGSILPRGKRRKVALARNRIGRRSDVVIRRAGTEAEALSAFEDLLRLHAARWRARGEDGVLADPQVVSFHRDAIPALLAAGLLRLYTLAIEGQVVAVQYGFHHGAESHAYLAGFDPAFEFESPGVVLMAFAIEEAMAEGARSFHFLRGREDYKYSWGAIDRMNCRRTFIRREPHVAAA